MPVETCNAFLWYIWFSEAPRRTATITDELLLPATKGVEM